MKSSQLWFLAAGAVIFAVIIDRLAGRAITRYPLTANVVAGLLGALLISLIVDFLIKRRDNAAHWNREQGRRLTGIKGFQANWIRLSNVIASRAPHVMKLSTFVEFERQLSNVRAGWRWRQMRNPLEYDGHPKYPIGEPPNLPESFTESANTVSEWIGNLFGAGVETDQSQVTQKMLTFLSRIQGPDFTQQDALMAELSDALTELEFSIDRYSEWHETPFQLLFAYPGGADGFSYSGAHNAEVLVVALMDALSDISCGFRKVIVVGHRLNKYFETC